MVERISALQGHLTPGRFGVEGTPGIALCAIEGLQLHQVAVWPGSIASMGVELAALLDSSNAATPGQAVGDADCALLRVEPLKWWLVGTAPPALDPQQGATLDLSHSRTRIRISGKSAADLLGRLLPLDLREQHFPIGSVASSAIHHVGVTLWRNEQGYELLVPRGYAVSVWEVVLQTALQFGVEVR